MTQIEQIKAEIERLKDFFKTERKKTTTTDKGMLDKLSFSSKIVVLEELLAFINLLPAEPSEEVEENIEGKINEYWNEWFSHGEYFEGTLPKNVFAAYCHKIAQWQKEKTINKASQWLNENVVEYHPRTGKLRPIVNINAFREAMEKEDEQ